ncbi:MAG TPA: AraC family transcriptional regulator [Pseudomonadales bacterium]|nr:AraC family transcriptional regulator [Pseudomonadales bacterium]
MKNQVLEQPNPANETGSHSRTHDIASEIAERIGRSIAYMVEHLDQPLQVSTLAAQASVSPSHYFALFKRQTGTAPIDFFIRLRMNHARQLLDSTCSSVKEIAATMGYDDPFYFSRVFKSVHQVAPAEYRRRNGQGRAAAQRTNGRSVQPLAMAMQESAVKQNRISFL